MLECEFGNASADLVMWGDLHAAHYLTLISQTYGGGKAYIDRGCIPAPNTWLITKSGQVSNPDCSENNQYVMDEILRLKPKIVVMASRWNRDRGTPLWP